MHLALLQNGYPTTIILPILRNNYITVIKQTQADTKDNRPFINFKYMKLHTTIRESIANLIL